MINIIQNVKIQKITRKIVNTGDIDRSRSMFTPFLYMPKGVIALVGIDIDSTEVLISDLESPVRITLTHKYHWQTPKQSNTPYNLEL